MKYLLDTNILIHLIRGSVLGIYIENHLQLFSPEHQVYISVVTKGELLSFAKQSNWGKAKLKLLSDLLAQLVCIPIEDNSPIFYAYADIDSFSQGKNPDIALAESFSARNMGKNDLWIAATAFLFNISLVTTDTDFQHLHPNIINVLYVPIQQNPAAAATPDMP